MACSVCCSLASCFGCRWSSRLAKLLYLLIFLGSAVLGIVLRYWGKEALSGWVTAIGGAENPCANGQCYGAQAAYRISFAVTVFFAVMVFFTAAVPVTHLGGWLVKLLLYVLALGLSLLMPNNNMMQYADAARGFSVIFLLLQVLILIDFAYNIHEWLIAKVEAKERQFELENWEPGVCSNGWRNLYMFLCFSLFGGALTGCALLYKYFGDCQLNQFFISETLVLGTVLTIISLMAVVGNGLLPPCIMFATNTYLLYGAITNNPDASCNFLARNENQNQASIIAGLAIAALSVTWLAFSTARGLPHAMRMAPTAAAAKQKTNDHGSTVTVANVAASGGAKDWPAGAASAPALADGSPASYQRAVEEDGERAQGRDASNTPLQASSASCTAAATAAGDDTAAGVEPRAWVFHVIMALGGLYLAMLVTNWGSPSDSASATGNPELSLSSMWARIGSQWAVHAVFIWTLLAPKCCPGRDFS